MRSDLFDFKFVGFSPFLEWAKETHRMEKVWVVRDSFLQADAVILVACFVDTSREDAHCLSPRDAYPNCNSVVYHF